MTAKQFLPEAYVNQQAISHVCRIEFRNKVALDLLMSRIILKSLSTQQASIRPRNSLALPARLSRFESAVVNRLLE